MQIRKFFDCRRNFFSWFVNLLDNNGNVKICEGMCPSYRKNGIIPLSHPTLRIYTYMLCTEENYTVQK